MKNHIPIVTTPGSGKSFSAKREIMCVFIMTNDDIICHDIGIPAAKQFVGKLDSYAVGFFVRNLTLCKILDQMICLIFVRGLCSAKGIIKVMFGSIGMTSKRIDEQLLLGLIWVTNISYSFCNGTFDSMDSCVCHGESFLAIAQDQFKPNGVYLLDEPEAALSPQRQ